MPVYGNVPLACPPQPLTRLTSLCARPVPSRPPSPRVAPNQTRTLLNAGNEQYNGAKQLYINRALVYGVKKECTDGNMNSWVLPLPFGRPVLRLTSKLFSSSGFEYSLTLGGDDKKTSVLYKSTQ